MRANLLILVALLIAGFGLVRLFEAPSFPAAPQFSFTALDGKPHSLREYNGKIVVLNFWATWCPPCIKEFPALLAAAKTHDEIILIALSSDIDTETIQKFLEKEKLGASAKNILIGLDEDNAAGKKFQSFRLPETFVIDRRGKIRTKFVGAAWQPEDLDAIIARLAAE